MGTDANRNFDFHWGDPGASTDPCDDAFMGSEAFSEVENRNLRDFVLEHRDNIKFFNTLHSYGRVCSDDHVSVLTLVTRWCCCPGVTLKPGLTTTTTSTPWGWRGPRHCSLSTGQRELQEQLQ